MVIRQRFVPDRLESEVVGGIFGSFPLHLRHSVIWKIVYHMMTYVVLDVMYY